MENQIQKQTNNLQQLKKVLSAESVTKKFTEMLGKKAPGFITSITNVVNNSDLLQKADVNSIILAASQAATLDLPINPNFGYAAIIPFKDTKKGVTTAQFQVMRSGWVELCMRTGQVVRIANEPVYEGELVSMNRFTDEYVFDESKRSSDKVIGYMAYAKLVNGFEKTIYWTVEKCKQHAMRYSQTYKKGFGNWVDQFDAMALKGLSVDTLIKTANKGWIKMGSIEKGDIVYDGEGRLTKVIAVSERKHIPCYKITFGNGQEVVCDEEHDWVVRHKSYNYFKQINIKELYELKAKGDSISILTTQQGGFDIELPIDPYCLGYWIGNGNRHNPTVTCNSKDTDFVAMKFRNAGFDVKISKNSENSDTLYISRIDKSVRTGGFGQALERSNLLLNKHIPEIYEFASYDQRLELIRGLLDSDGCCTTRKQGAIRASFCQEASKKHIVDSLYRLLCSIGEQPSMPIKMRGKGFGKYIESYKIQFTPREEVFGVPRKNDMLKSRYLCPSWAISSIEKIDPVETVCIAVDSPSKTYLCTESQIRTHNTVLKHLIVKYLPKSIELQTAIEADQASFTGDIDNPEPVYVDNTETVEYKEVPDDGQDAEPVSVGLGGEISFEK